VVSGTLDPNRRTDFTCNVVVHIHAIPTYSLIMHSDREHRAALTSATGYIVVFKKGVSEAEKRKWKEEIAKSSE